MKLFSLASVVLFASLASAQSSAGGAAAPPATAAAPPATAAAPAPAASGTAAAGGFPAPAGPRNPTASSAAAPVAPAPTSAGSPTGVSSGAKATHTVMVGGPAGNVFSPASVPVNVGDTVLFMFQTSTHNVIQSDAKGGCTKSTNPGAFQFPATGLAPQGQTWPYTVAPLTPTAKAIWFYCGPHCDIGMTGGLLLGGGAAGNNTAGANAPATPGSSTGNGTSTGNGPSSNGANSNNGTTTASSSAEYLAPTYAAVFATIASAAVAVALRC